MRFLGFPKMEDCLIREVELHNIFADVLEAQKWLTPEMGAGEADVKRALESNPNWTKFVEAIGPGDELWYYRFPEDRWRKLRGSHGYVIVKNRKYQQYFEFARN